MDSTDKLWLSRGEALGGLLSKCRRTSSLPAAPRAADSRAAVDPLADPLEAARFSASIALAMRNGALRRGNEARAEALRAMVRWMGHALGRWFAPRSGGVPVAVPVRKRTGRVF